MASISLLTQDGLRVSEAFGADIEALGLERRHRTLTVLVSTHREAVLSGRLRLVHDRERMTGHPC